MANKRQQSFSKLYQLSILIILTLLFITLGTVWILHEYNSHRDSLAKMREDYISTRKQEVMQEVNIHLEDIRFQISTMESQLRHKLQAQTENGWAIADNIYRHNAGTLSDRQIKKLIIEALMPQRFFNGRGYYWILDTDHKMVAHPFNSNLVGKSQADLTDREGQKFIRNSVRVAQENEQGGFVSYFWNKPGVGERLSIEKGEHKIAFLKLFKPFNWIIGTGEYVHDVEKELQNKFLARMNSIQSSKKGYIFTHTFEGVCLSHPNRNNIGKNRWNYQDANGKKVVQEVIQIGQQPGGGFVEYLSSLDPKSGKPSPKISFVNSLPQWRWVLGAGVYLNDINKTMAGFRQDLRSELIHRSLTTIILILGALALGIWLSYLFGKRLTRELNIFSTFFKQSATQPQTINADQMTISEFGDLARAANQMVEERQRIQFDLQQSKEVWEKSFNAISDFVTIHDKDSRIIRTNNAVCKFLNKQPEEIVGKLCHEVFQQNAERCPNCPGRKTLIDKHSHTAAVPFPKVDKTFQVSTAPTFDDQDQLEYIVHVAKDITEQKRLEEELLHSRKMEAMGTLAGGIAHDFNNILTSLLGYADLAEENTRNHDKTNSYIQQVIMAGNRAAELVKQILAFSRKSEQSLTHISPSRIVAEALKLIRAACPTTIKIQVEIVQSDDYILADPTKIHQVVINLCTNALHSMENQQGTMSIRLIRKELTAEELQDQTGIAPGPFMELTIADTGHGIEANIIGHVFDPYFTTKEVGKGVGMGLAMVHGIVKEYGGLIKVESKLMHGTTFRVYLPITANNAPPQISTPIEPLPNGNEQIMVIDDEKSICYMLKGSLERFGYRITAITNSQEALTEFTTNPDKFDLIITDQNMPKLSGMALAQEVLKLRPSLPIIIYSGFNDQTSEMKALELGIKKFLLKPIDSKTMAVHIRKLLDERQAPA